MPRDYKRKTDRVHWSQEQLTNAKEAVKDGMSVKQAAHNYGIPRTTLQDHVCGKVARSKLGPLEPVFTPDQEQDLVRHLLDLESRFYGITMEDVRKLAFQLAVKNNICHPFNEENQMAGRDWLNGFLKRNPNLSFRKPEATSAARARAFNKPVVYAFFDMYESELTRMGFTADRIYNSDETGITTVPPNKKKIAAKKGKKQVGIISSAERGETTTVVMTMSASGRYIPPFVIFPRARMNDGLKHGAPPGTKFECTPSGYMNLDLYSIYFDHFVEHTHPSESNPLLLLIDGHSSHTKNLAVIEKARKSHVTIVVLPPHCSNKLQPLDVSFMAPFKSYYASASETFLRSKPGHVINQYDIMQLMATAFGKAATQPIAVSGFKKCGLWPCDRLVFDDSSFAPSLVTDRALPDTEAPSTSKKEPEAGLEFASICKKVQETELESACTDEMEKDTESESTATSNSILLSLNDSQQSSGSFTITPEEILPLPKMVESRVPSKRKRRSEKATVITSDCYLQNLSDAQATKDIASIKKSQRATSRKGAKRQKPNNLSSEDSLCDRCGSCFSQSANGKGWKTCTSCKKWFHEPCFQIVDVMCDSCS